ncbi:MAG: hypothetical protein ACE5GC_06140 [Acidimicrobiia bacterium]
MAVEVLVEYTVAEGREAEADRVRAAFLEAVAGWHPEQFTYRVLKRGAEGQAFVHLAWLDSPETQQALFDTDFFKEFNEGMQHISGGTVNASPLLPWNPA